MARASFVWTLALVSVCQAEPARLLTHDGASMTFSRGADGIEISYVEVPPGLREIGVTPGTVLVQGKWEDTVLVGEAYAFSKDCRPLAYPVRGVVDRGGALIVIGPVPTSCKGDEFTWGTGSVMRFEPGEALRRSETRETKPQKPKEQKPKAKPPPKPKPKPRPAPVQRDPWQQQQWRWF